MKRYKYEKSIKWKQKLNNLIGHDIIIGNNFKRSCMKKFTFFKERYKGYKFVSESDDPMLNNKKTNSNFINLNEK